jgi:hypothetical protein
LPVEIISGARLPIKPNSSKNNMKKLLWLPIVFVVACNSAAPEQKTEQVIAPPAVPSPIVRCDSGEIRTPQPNGDILVTKGLLCDTFIVRCDSVETRNVDPKTGEEIIEKKWLCDTVHK